MKSTALLLLFALCFNIQSFSQIKVWNKKFKREKVKGFYSQLEEPILIPIKNTSEIAAIIPAAVSFAIKYGNYAAKKATSKNEKDYKSESTCLNEQVIPFESFKDHIVQIKANHFFYKRSNKDTATNKNIAATYIFNLIKEGSSLKVVLDNSIKENYLPIKFKSNYDFLISNFDISISAIITEEIDSLTDKRKIIDLGSATIYKINPSFKTDEQEIINSGSFLIPYITEKGKEISLGNLIIKVKINHINPYGTTTNALNDFFEKNSEANEELLNGIFIRR